MNCFTLGVDRALFTWQPAPGPDRTLIWRACGERRMALAPQSSGYLEKGL